MHISIPVSPGELMDKITILEIKLSEITDEKKLQNVRSEYEILVNAQAESMLNSAELLLLRESLFAVNKKIWESENDIREFWNDETKFIAAARQSHYYNDERARLKREISILAGSDIIEEKSHPAYKHTI